MLVFSGGLRRMKGGCHCGAIRYEVSAAPFDADYCHCRDCQKITGAPVGAWMDFQKEQVLWLDTEPAEYKSSEHIRRGFCPQCGSTLSYRSARYPDYFTLSIASLDEPDRVKPNYHIHTDSQLNWLSIVDDCARYRKERETGAVA